MMQIRAAVVREPAGRFQIESLALEEPREDEVLVKIAGVGVCHTDLVCRDQYFPVPLPCVFGHEGSGVVERVGSRVTKVVPGDHVVLSFSSCNSCQNCMAGMPAYCEQLYQHNFAGTRGDSSTAMSGASGPVHAHFFAQSSFGTFALARERNTVKVSHEVPLWLLGPLACGVQTGAGAILNSLRPRAGTSVAIFGAGTVGLSAVMGAVLCGCSRIIAIDPVGARRDLARMLGATDVIDPTAVNPVEVIQSLTGQGVDFSLECTGMAAVVRQAVDCLRLTGICGVIGVSRLGTEVTLDMNSLLFGRSVRGIIEGDSIPGEFIPRLVELFRQGRFPFDKLVTEFPFDDIERAVRESEQGRVVKAILRMA